jgi:hypothetical protein
MDCFVAFAPRNDVADLTPAVILRESGVSSTPQLLGFIVNASGILDRPVKPGDDKLIRLSLLATHFAPELCMYLVPRKTGGRRESRVPVAPAASHAK